MDRILIRGLRESGVHGVLPEEKERPQPFEVDVELSVDLARAGGSDDLQDTIDYAAICEAVSRVISTERHELIERLAERIAQVCGGDARVRGIVVEVRKLEPPVAAALDHVAVRIER
ncbi:MAG: dihydroneopterin aldolase [Acidimicrobiia bacterium]|nr:dihydroneopterin aldolase [Acidimicrobiia bacterium]